MNIFPNKNQMRVEDTTEIIKEISNDLKSWLDQNRLVLNATGIEASWPIPTKRTLSKKMKIIEAGRNPSKSIAGK